MKLLTLAPLSDSYDMFIGLGFCYLPVFILLYIAYKSYKSGSMVKIQKQGAPQGVTEWVESDKKIPYVQNAWFKFAMVWLILGSIFFWGMLYPDYQDVWFITK